MSGPLRILHALQYTNRASKIPWIHQFINNLPNFIRTSSSIASNNRDPLLCASDEQTLTEIQNSFTIKPNFISEKEESNLYEEVHRYLRRSRYEYDHWDDAIHGFRETERAEWNEANSVVIQRVRDTAFANDPTTMSRVHVLDLSKDGYIKPHIDAIRFCGDTIAGISLLSASIMRLVHDKDKSKWADCLLDRRSLYIMRGTARYDYTHEILKNEESVFNGVPIPKDRRISIMCRKEPPSSAADS